MLVGSARRSSSGAAEHQENRAVPAERVVHARAHPAVMEALRVGRLVAWRKLAAGVSEHLSSETCCGDLSARGLCNRSLRSSSKPACRSSYLSTRAGPAPKYSLRPAADPRATILPGHAERAYNHVSRAAMLGALRERAELQPLLPYVSRTSSSSMQCRVFTRGWTPVGVVMTSCKVRAAKEIH